MDFYPLCHFLYFCNLPFVALITIDSSELCKSLVGIEVQSPRVIERDSKKVSENSLTQNYVLLSGHGQNEWRILTLMLWFCRVTVTLT